MYSLAEVRDALKNPHLIFRELNRLYYSRLWTCEYNPAGVDIFDRDWDTLVILDACRYDTFAERASLSGDLSKVTSRGAATPEFVKANFAGRNLHDTVYVSRNTWFLKLRDELNADLHAFYHPEGRSVEPTTENALTAAEKHPNKRLIVHYLPPHHPFVGPTADEHFPEYDDQSTDLFARIQRGDIDVSDDLLRQAYAENLDRVLPEVERLLDELDGKTVITADHGELLGDVTAPVPVADYGHHIGLYVDELVKVPWLEVNSDSRREVVSDPPVGADDGLENEAVDERLRDLGYKV